MSKINLHMHSNHSLDGKLSPNEVINKVLASEITYLSITDHDNCDAYLELDLNKVLNSGTLVYGMEADAIINDVTYDILCYGFELENVRTWAREQYGTVATRQVKIYRNLVEKCESLKLVLDENVPYNPEEEFAHAAIFRMLNTSLKNKAFLEEYNVSNVSALYRLSTMNKSFPLYVDMHIVWPDITVLGEVIHDNGGKLFLAHPYKYSKEVNIEEMLNSCRTYIDGIEVSNESENADQVNYLYDYAIKNNLLVSAGSDFHGSKGHNNLMVNYLSEEMEDRIENWITTVPGKVKILKK